MELLFEILAESLVNLEKKMWKNFWLPKLGKIVTRINIVGQDSWSYGTYINDSN